MPRTRSGRRLRVECLEDRLAPATFSVTTALDVVNPVDGVLSLREAITRANTRAGGDTITLPAGVFKIGLTGAAENLNATGDFDVTGDTLIRGAGASLTAIDAQQLDRAFDVLGTAPSSIRVAFQSLTVRNGSSPASGGGIEFGNADLVLRDCAVTGNRAGVLGGGISNTALPGTGNATLVRTLVSRNVAGLSGGGVVCVGSNGLGGVLVARDSTVRRNLAGAGAGGFGGGIAASTANLINSTVTGNSGDEGGGVFATTANLTDCVVSGNHATARGGGINANEVNLLRSTVSGNRATSQGGGIHAGTVTLIGSSVSGNTADDSGGGINAAIATLTSSTVSGNSGAIGGGILAQTANMTGCTVSGNSASEFGGGICASPATLTNCTVSGNTAGTNGGGIFASTATLLNCTIVENVAQTGGGYFRGGSGVANVKNTLIALNLVGPGGSGPDVAGDFTSQGHNLIGDGSGGTGFADGVNGDRVGTAANPIDARLGPLKKNGGPTRTHALLPGSPAIDRGDNANITPTDQRGPGFARRRDGNGDGRAVADIGAFEV